MAETIRVTVEVPALSEAQILALRSLAATPTPLWAAHLPDAEMDALFDAELAMFVDPDGMETEITKLGRAILEHYEREGGG